MAALGAWVGGVVSDIGERLGPKGIDAASLCSNAASTVLVIAASHWFETHPTAGRSHSLMKYVLMNIADNRSHSTSTSSCPILLSVLPQCCSLSRSHLPITVCCPQYLASSAVTHHVNKLPTSFPARHLFPVPDCRPACRPDAGRPAS